MSIEQDPFGLTRAFAWGVRKYSGGAAGVNGHHQWLAAMVSFSILGYNRQSADDIFAAYILTSKSVRGLDASAMNGFFLKKMPIRRLLDLCLR